MPLTPQCVAKLTNFLKAEKWAIYIGNICINKLVK